MPTSKGLPEEFEGWVPYKGEVGVVMQEMSAGLQASMGYAGARRFRNSGESTSCDNSLRR